MKASKEGIDSYNGKCPSSNIKTKTKVVDKTGLINTKGKMLKHDLVKNVF